MTMKIGLYVLNSTKRTDKKFTTEEVYYKDNDLDTVDTQSDLTKNISNLNSSKTKKQEMKEKYMSEGFYGNYDLIPKEISDMLQALTQTTDEAEKFYNIILTAKNHAR